MHVHVVLVIALSFTSRLHTYYVLVAILANSYAHSQVANLRVMAASTGRPSKRARSQCAMCGETFAPSAVTLQSSPLFLLCGECDLFLAEAGHSRTDVANMTKKKSMQKFHEVNEHAKEWKANKASDKGPPFDQEELWEHVE